VSANAVVSLRDLGPEQRFLADATRGHEPFAEHAAARLEHGEPLYGDSCRTSTVTASVRCWRSWRDGARRPARR
jgi:hypothetical protein